VLCYYEVQEIFFRQSFDLTNIHIMRIALVSDIHGNLPALLAVVADIQRRDVDQIVNLGDSLSGPLLPAETAQYLMQQPWVQLAGNHERQILACDADHGAPADRYARSKLNPQMLEWVAQLPPTSRFSEDVFLCHGTPTSDLTYFLETVTPHSVRIASLSEIDERCGSIHASVICCGHSHVPRAIRSRNGTLLVNPGSVGLPAYDDDHLYFHLVENGSPDARYAIIEGQGNQWQASLHAVPYDQQPMVELALRNGRPDWAIAIRTGYMTE
jgi:putative phosphoesterase